MTKRRSPRRKHIPERKCIACRTRRPKRDLVRVVRLADGSGVAVDETGKRNGRGAYLCRQRACWIQAIQRQGLNRALRTPLTQAEIDALLRYAEAFPETLDTGEQKEGV